MNYTTIALPTDGDQITGQCYTEQVDAVSPKDAALKVFERDIVSPDRVVLVVEDGYTHAFRYVAPAPTVITA